MSPATSLVAGYCAKRYTVRTANLENEVHGLRFLHSYSNPLLHGPELFVPSADRILARRQVLQLKAAILSRDVEEGVLEDGDVGAHPRMLVALHRNGNLLPREGSLEGRLAGRLRFVPFPVVDRNRVNIVRCRIAVDDLDLLVGLHGEDV